MSYFVIRREKCEKCDGTGNQTFIDTTRTHDDVTVPCANCKMTGNIDTPVDLLDVLNKLVWDGRTVAPNIVERLSMNNVRIEEK